MRAVLIDGPREGDVLVLSDDLANTGHILLPVAPRMASFVGDDDPLPVFEQRVTYYRVRSLEAEPPGVITCWSTTPARYPLRRTMAECLFG